jgi:hypothetical protein
MKKLIDIINKIRKPKDKPSILSYSIVEFTNESWISSLTRQGRLRDYLSHK